MSHTMSADRLPAGLGNLFLVEAMSTVRSGPGPLLLGGSLGERGQGSDLLACGDGNLGVDEGGGFVCVRVRVCVYVVYARGASV